MFGHVASLNIYDPSGAPGGAGVEATRQLILERIDQLAPFRRRLVEVPFGLDLPYWIEDPYFDLDFHVRHHAVPPPGTPEATGRGGQPDPRPAARPQPAAVGAVRHRGRRRRATDRPAHQGPPRGDRWRRRRADAGGDARRGAGRASDGRAGDLDAGPGPQRRESARAHDGRVRPPAGEVHPALGQDAAPARLADPQRRGARPRRHGRPADPRAARRPAPPAPAQRAERGRRPAAAPSDGGAAHAVERDDHAAPAVRLHDDPAGGGEEDPPVRRVHVQRRRAGAVLGNLASLPARARLPCPTRA